MYAVLNLAMMSACVHAGQKRETLALIQTQFTAQRDVKWQFAYSVSASLTALCVGSVHVRCILIFVWLQRRVSPVMHLNAELIGLLRHQTELVELGLQLMEDLKVNCTKMKITNQLCLTLDG